MQELKLSSDYLFLLRVQSSFDLVRAEKITLTDISQKERDPRFRSLLQLYLITSTPITAFPYVFPDFSKSIELFVLPWIFPFVQVSAMAWVLSKNNHVGQTQTQTWESLTVLTPTAQRNKQECWAPI